MPGLRSINYVQPAWGRVTHGGVSRTAQLAALFDSLEDASVKTFAIEPWASLAPARKAGIALASLCSPGADLRGMIAQARVAEGFRRSGVADGSVLVQEARPDFGASIAREARRRRLRMISFPHNIESLVAPSRDPTNTAAALGRELEALGSSTGVFTISSSDAFLLSLFGITATTLPYLPDRGRRAELLAIRAARAAGAVGSFVLIVGTAGNEPTRRGMESQLRHLESRPRAASLPVVVAGNGTDALRSSSDAVLIKGPVSSAEMKQLWIDAELAWVMQPPTTGALTRITELLIAGVPTLCNAEAVRSLPGGLDIDVYETFARIELSGAGLKPPTDPTDHIQRQIDEAWSQCKALLADA